MLRRNSRIGRHSNISRRRLFLERLEERSLLAVVSHWAADNTPADSVGTNHGSLVSGTAYAAGQIGQAFSFDGVDDRVQVADSDSLKLTNSLTIEGWVKATGLPTQHGMILFRGDDRGGLDPYWLSLESNGQLVFVVENGTESAGVSTTMPMNQFVHVAGTLDDATGALRLYLNGVLVSQTATAVRPFRDLDPAFNPGIGIGNHGGYPSTPHNFPFRGLIDELRVHDQALTAEELAGIFAAGRGGQEPIVSVSDATGFEGQPGTSYLGNLVNQLEGGLDDPNALEFGPDGNLYVSARSGSSVLRFDAATGAPLPAPGKPGAEFVSPRSGGLDMSREIAFGPDGNLYVVSEFGNAILRYEALTGEPLGAFVAAGSGGLERPRGLLFHDGYLYVTSVGLETSSGAGKDAILRFDASTGAPAGLSGQLGDAVFIPTGTGGMDNPSQIVFHAGDFYVSSTSPSTSNSVLRFGTDGTFQGAFVPTGSGGLSGPVDLVFRDGYLYVTSWANNKVLRYDGATGAFVDQVVTGGGLARPMGLLFRNDGSFLVSSGDSDEIRTYGVGPTAVFTISLSAPFPTTVSVGYASADGTALAGSDYVPVSGSVTFEPGQRVKTIAVAIVNDAAGESTETFSINLFGVTGGALGDSTGAVTIIDDDPGPTKFFVVDDGVTNRTYEYGPFVNALENYSLDTANMAPRGAASTAAGNKVWVVDANKKVYVYDDSGGLLGSWMAGSLSGSAQVEGIATNGTDIWIVDAKADKVYRYANAASRLSGTQNAASSFALFNKGPISPDYNNKNPKDMVTDGTYLWVLNDGVEEDKVFKYTLSGTPTFSNGWGIDPINSQPTGITLDPGNPNHLWIVDAGTDRIYQYDGGVFFGGGGLPRPSSSSFPLAPGNTNPQGIADPPVSGSAVPPVSVAADNDEVALATFVGPISLPAAGRGEKTSARAARSEQAAAHWIDAALAAGIDVPRATIAETIGTSPSRKTRPAADWCADMDALLADDEVTATH